MRKDGVCCGKCESCKSKSAESKGDALTEAYLRGCEAGAEIAEKKLRFLLEDATFNIIRLERKLMEQRA